MSLGMNMGW